MPINQISKFPKAKRKPGNPPRYVLGREAAIEQQGLKWVFKFKRGDFEDMEFNTEQEAKDYQKQIQTRSVKMNFGKARLGK